MGDLFGHVRQRAKPRKLMHAIDAGHFPDGRPCARFKCKRCPHDSGWVYATPREAICGVPCPRCSEGSS